MIYIPIITNRLNREATTCAGNAATKLFATTARNENRAGVTIHNADTSLSLWVMGVARGAAAPTISQTSKDYVIPANSTLDIPFGSAIDLYVQNSSVAATTSSYVAYEVLS